MPGSYGRIGDPILIGGSLGWNHAHSNVSLLSLAGGNFVVAWTSEGFAVEFPATLFRVFSATGQSLAFHAFNPGSMPFVYDPTVRPTSDGGFVVGSRESWVGYGYQIFDAQGVAAGPLFISGAVQVQSATRLPNGTSVFCWTADGRDGSGSAVVAQLVAPDGTLLGPSYVVNSSVAGNQSNPSVSHNEDGGFVVTWTDTGAGPNPVLRGQVYSASGQAVGGEFPAQPTVSAPPVSSTVVLPNGDTLTVWMGPFDEGNAIWSQVRDALGAVVGAPTLVANLFQGLASVRATLLTNGAVAVTWTEFGGIHGPGGADVFGQILYPNSGTEGADVATDTLGSDILVTGGGDDRISLSTGNDVANGGAGQDTLVLYWSDTISPVSATVAQSVDPEGGYSGTFGASGRSGRYISIERFDLRTGSGNDVLTTGAGNDLIQSGAGADVVFGMGGNDYIVGGAGNDSLDGGAGADTTVGGVGDDVHYVDSVDDQVTERQGEGRDFVYTTSHYTLRPGTEVEVLRARDQNGTEAINLFGNEFANVLHGNNGANILRGGAGDDLILGYLGDDNIDGGAGADNLTGGLGDDTYHVDNASDLVVENAGEGRDTIFSAGSYNLREFEHVELLIAADRMGIAALNFTGNSLANIIKGNAGANILGGGAGDDILLGYEGNDNLNGGAGADNLTGGLGDDTYHVDNASDVVVEHAGEGRDTIFSAGSYNLREFEHVELLVAANPSGTAALNFSGNSIANIIKGNAGANSLNGGAGDDILLGFDGADTLIGGAGADVMTGGLGDDIYYVDSASDVIVELAGEGRDRVFVTSSYILRENESIEYISTADKLARTAINLTGNSGDNIIFGNAGRNIFDGKGGNDILVGLEDADRFLFSTTLNGLTNVDTIQGFEIGYDKIWLDDAIFTGLSVGALAAGAFVVGAAAADADDRIIYNSANGSLLFDRDGAGGAAAVQFAIVDPNLIVTAYDFLIF